MQDILVYAIVAGAAFYVGRSFWLGSKSSGCGGCSKTGGKCASKTLKTSPDTSPQEPQLIQISLGSSKK